MFAYVGMTSSSLYQSLGVASEVLIQVPVDASHSLSVLAQSRKPLSFRACPIARLHGRATVSP